VVINVIIKKKIAAVSDLRKNSIGCGVRVDVGFGCSCGMRLDMELGFLCAGLSVDVGEYG